MPPLEKKELEEQSSPALKIILIHGNGGGTPHDNWFPSVKKEFEKLGLTVVAQQFPDNNLARMSQWLPFLKEKLKADAQTILIGHSSGGLAALRYAEKYPIFASVLVGVNCTHLNDDMEKKSGYFDKPLDWQKIKSNQQWIMQFASTDDPLIPIEEPRFIYGQLNTDYYVFTDQGHFGGDWEKKEFPELVQLVKTKVFGKKKKNRF